MYKILKARKRNNKHNPPVFFFFPHPSWLEFLESMLEINEKNKKVSYFLKKRLKLNWRKNKLNSKILKYLGCNHLDLQVLNYWDT